MAHAMSADSKDAIIGTLTIEAVNRLINELCKSGHVAMAKVLFADPRINLRATNPPNDNSAIESAASNGHWGIVELLLEDERVNPGLTALLSKCTAKQPIRVPT